MEKKAKDKEEERRLLQRGADVSSVGGSHEDLRPAVSVTPVPEQKKYFLETFFPLDPRRWLHRYCMLALMCFLSFGSYYVYDNPAALQKTIIKTLNIDVTRYSLLYSLYSWPNVVLSVFGGFLLDRVFGIRLGTFIFSVLICIGQLIFALGAFYGSFITMAAGRFVFGLGGENLAVAQNTYAVMWFKGKELNMVFGLLLSVSRIGSTVNMNINQKMFDNTFSYISSFPKRLGVVLFIGLLFCIFSLACAVFLGLFDWRAEKILRRKEEKSAEKIRIKDVKDFPLRLWLIFLICVAYYVTVFPFIGLATVFLVDKYAVSSSQANILNSLVYLISAGASPFIGVLVDWTGFNLTWLNLGTILTLVAHVMFAFLGNGIFIPYLAMAIMGLAYSLLACALWPLVAFIVPEYQLGTAYGIMQAIQNLGLAVITIITGALVDHYGYLILEVFFIANLCIALIAGILLYILDSGSGGRLNMAAWTRKKLEKQEEEEKSFKTKSVERGEINAKPVSKDAISTNTGDVFDSGIGAGSYTSPITPNSAFQIRNRMLSRMGAKFPDHLMTFNPLTASQPHLGVLK